MTIQNQGEFPSDAWELLSARLTENRKQKMLDVASNRTRHIQLVIQDVHNPHNISACLRSAEAFGVLEAHVVNLNNPFKASTVGRGVHNWLHIHKYSTVKECADYLHSQGMLIAAGMPAQGSKPIDELAIDKPIAILFGNEHAGVSPEWNEYIDIFFTIPMFGFVESMNISVCAALSMQILTHKSRNHLPSEKYNLTQPEQSVLLNEWVCRQITTWEGELKRLRK